MKITVLNGSPKGTTSVTMQYVHYIQKEFLEHKLKILNISQRIRKIEKDAQAFQNILDEINSSDGVLWASPVYYLLVPANYKRFILTVKTLSSGQGQSSAALPSEQQFVTPRLSCLHNNNKGVTK